MWRASPLLLLSLAFGTAHANAPIACECVLDSYERNPAYECATDALPEGAEICQRLGDEIFCNGGQNPGLFTGDVSCSEGFCISFDGETCTEGCGCSNF